MHALGFVYNYDKHLLQTPRWVRKLPYKYLTRSQKKLFKYLKVDASNWSYWQDYTERTHTLVEPIVGAIAPAVTHWKHLKSLNNVQVE